jgi:beta-galactosidase/beta-glucuronidase
MDLDALSAPLPCERRDRRLSLDGTWELELEPGAPPVPIVVPFTFEAPLSGIGRPGEVHERLRYRRTFRVPPAWHGDHVLLRFGAVDWHAVVRVDGSVVGEHRGGYAHFTCELGPLEGEHELVVEVHDPVDGPQPRGKQRGSGGIWYARTTGIWRPVWLEAAPAAHITSFVLEPRPDGTVDARVETSAPTDVSVEVARTDAPRWSPERPELVDVVLRAASGDVVRSYVAFRWIERAGSELLLNGEPLRFCGVLDQGYWPAGGYTAPDGDALRADVEAAKALGLDLARMHVKVADPRWYAWCDALGLLVLQDLPSPLRLDTPDARAGFVRELDEIVEQLRGHPSVIGWVAFNEDWGEPREAFQLSVARRLRERDPSRIVVDASGWVHRGESDVLDVHDYGDDLSRHASGELPLVVGECGGVSLVVGGEEDFAYRHVASSEALATEYARLVGELGDVAGFVWTQLTDVEGELNGLLGHDRRPKAPPDSIRAANEAFRVRQARRAAPG